MIKASKYWNGRKVKSEKIIPAGSGKVKFGACYEAEAELVKEGYIIGTLDGSNPIGIWYNKGSLPVFTKWHSLSKERKNELAGVLVSEDFENKDVKIIFFNNE